LVAPARLQRILVPMDFSPHARRALEAAKTLARQAGPAHLILVTSYFVPVELEALGVPDDARVLHELEQKAARDLEALLVELSNAGISSEYVAQKGAPARVIVELARAKGADLIALGTHGRTGVAHALLGSVAERVVREAPCPVLTVH
jgi:nucleotide-binding universal stress UspA family protein